jgi:hypothetical protein
MRYSNIFGSMQTSQSYANLAKVCEDTTSTPQEFCDALEEFLVQLDKDPIISKRTNINQMVLPLE